jgi:hypothetical protein
MSLAALAPTALVPAVFVLALAAIATAGVEHVCTPRSFATTTHHRSDESEWESWTRVTVMSSLSFGNLFPGLALQKSDVLLKTYTGEPMRIVGEVMVCVCYKDQQPQELPLVIVEGSGPILLGRNWLPRFRLDWKTINEKTRFQDYCKSTKRFLPMNLVRLSHIWLSCRWSTLLHHGFIGRDRFCMQ